MANPIKDILNLIGIGRTKPDQIFEDASTEEVKTDISLAVGDPKGSVTSAIRSRSKTLGRTLSYEFQGQDIIKRSGANQFVPPVHDLAEVARAADVEPYIDQSIRKHREMILKEGYTIEGNDDNLVQYIKARLFEMALVTGIPTESLIREGLTNLVKYHNSAYVLRRDITRSKGRKIRLYGKTLDPIAGMFILDPTTVQVKVDRYGTPKKWQQTLSRSSNTGGAERAIKRFNPEDVVFVTVDKNTGFSFGTPYILPVLDDVRALRRLEELAVMLASKEVFPLYHYKVGTDKLPAMHLEGGGDEVDLVSEVTLVSSDGGTLDIQPFLEYFEARVMGGLRLSPLDLGRGGTANRACYSGDTETLTDKGWKNHWDVDVDNDLIGTFNPNTQQLEFHKAESKHVYPYAGKMYHFKARMTDVLVTPDHDMWLRYTPLDGEYPETEWRKIHAEDVRKDEPFQFQIQAEWNEQGKALEPIQLGDHPEIPVDTWLRFLAYFIKCGKVTPSRNEMKFIVRSRPVAETLKDFVKALPFEFRIYDNDDYIKFAANDIDLVKHLSMVCSCRTYPKRIPYYVMGASIPNLKLFFEELVPTEPFDGASIYYARTYALSGQVQEIAFKLGYHTKVLEDTRKPRVMISSGASTDELTSDSITQKDYEGDVYCFNVPNHLFITRRNGKIAIQGNTAGTINKNVQDAAKDYQQAYSTAVSFGLFLPMLLEGGFNVTEENMVFLTFPAIDREELRAQQNHGQQLYLGNAITCTEFRKDYLNMPEMTEEQAKDTTRERDAAIDEKLTRVAGSFKTTTSTGSTAKKSTSSASKSASNRGQPRNQSGTKSSKTRAKANDYVTTVRAEFDSFREKVIMLVEADQDEVDQPALDLALRNEFGQLVTNCMTAGKKFLQELVEEGVCMVSDQAEETEEEIVIGRRAMTRFYTNCVEKSFWKTVSPYRDQVCGCTSPDEDGNSPRYMTYGALSSMWISLERLARDQSRAAKRFGFAKAARTLGYVSMEMENPESGDRKTIELNRGPIVYKNLIPSLNDAYDDLQLGSKLIKDSTDDGD
jgi:hypothetical protein